MMWSSAPSILDGRSRTSTTFRSKEPELSSPVCQEGRNHATVVRGRLRQFGGEAGRSVRRLTGISKGLETGRTEDTRGLDHVALMSLLWTGPFCLLQPTLPRPTEGQVPAWDESDVDGCERTDQHFDTVLRGRHDGRSGETTTYPAALYCRVLVAIVIGQRELTPRGRKEG